MEVNPYKSPDSDAGSDAKIDVRDDLRLTSKSLFKVLFVGYLFGLGPLLLLNGIYDYFTGSESIVNFNEEKLTGISGLIGVIIFIPIFSIIFSVLTWGICAFGLWLYGLNKPVKLEFK